MRYVGWYLFALVMVSKTWGDGCFVTKKAGTDLREPQQKAIIHWRDGKLVMVLQVKYKGATSNFGWVIPVPGKPKVDVIAPAESPFEEITEYCDNRAGLLDDEEDVWGDDDDAWGGDDAEGVEVIEEKTVGVYDVAVLAAEDPEQLAEWLKKHGFAFPEKRAEVLKHYTEKEWFYVATRITRTELGKRKTKNQLRNGELQPIRLTFDSKQMVYPLKISSINKGMTEVLLYLVSSQPMVYKSGPKSQYFSIETQIPPPGRGRFRNPKLGLYAKTNTETVPLTGRALGLGPKEGFYICRYRPFFADNEMTDDLTFTDFDPVKYWRRVLVRSVRKGSSVDRRRALSVLSHYKGKSINDMVASDEAEERELAAALIRKNTPIGLARTLSADRSPEVRRVLAANPYTPYVVLESMLNHDNDALVKQAVLHINPARK